MSIYDNYYKRMINSAKGEKERRLERMSYSITSKFDQDTAYEKLDAIEPDGTITTKELKVIHGDYITHLNPNRIQSLYFVGIPGQKLTAGTVLKNLMDNDWMVTASSELTGLLYRGMIQILNYPDFKWVFDGKLYSSPAIVSGVSRRSDGIEEKRVMVLPEDAIAVSVPANEITNFLERDIRFLVFDTPYKITKVDRYTDPYLVNIIATEDFYSESGDNTELGIANYNLLEQTFEPNETGFSISIEGPDILRTEKSGTFFGVVYENGEETLNGVVWSLENEDGTINQYLTITSESNNSIVLRATSNFNYIGKTIKLKATYNATKVEKIITIIGLV